MLDNDTENLMGKYQLAGKIRLISFSMLLLFLLLMKSVGGYAYLNTALISLILVEAILNQPYRFIVKRVNIHRLQYYQMTVDIIVISWLLYYMGGIDAPVIGIAYYAIILWAGVASTPQAVFFAAVASTVSYSSIVLLEHSGLISQISLFDDKMPDAKMFSILVGNIAHLFAFGYFSAYSSKVIKSLEKKQRDESLRYAHKFSAIDHLIVHTTHDMLGRFHNVKACAELLLHEHTPDNPDNEMLKMIVEEEGKGVALLNRLSKFSRKKKPEFENADINEIIEDAINLTWPLIRYSTMTIEKAFAVDLPLIPVIRDQMQEVFVAIILNALDATVEKSTLTIQTDHHKEKKHIEIKLSDTGVGIKQEYLNQIAEPFFTTEGYRERLGIGLAISHEIIATHKGTMQFKSAVGRGTTFIIHIPVEKQN